MLQAAVPLDEVADVGFTQASIFDGAQVRALAALVQSVGLAEDHRFYASVAHGHGPAAHEFNREATALVGPTLAGRLPGFRVFLASVTSKGSRCSDPLPFHHDWTYTDERRFQTRFLWCPLVATSEANGTLRVVPGSHRWTRGIRPSRAAEVTEGFQPEFDSLSVPVPLEPGDALVFDPATIHGSGPNLTDRPRPAVTFALVEQDAPLLHFHELADGTVEGVEVSDEFFTDHPYGTRPRGFRPYDPWGPATTANDFERALASALPAPRKASSTQ